LAFPGIAILYQQDARPRQEPIGTTSGGGSYWRWELALAVGSLSSPLRSSITPPARRDRCRWSAHLVSWCLSAPFSRYRGSSARRARLAWVRSPWWSARIQCHRHGDRAARSWLRPRRSL